MKKFDETKIPRLEDRRAIQAATARERAKLAEIAAIEQRYEEMPEFEEPDCMSDVLEYDDDALPVCCAMTGLPLLDDDEILVDEDAGEKYLRVALGLPLSNADADDVQSAAA